MKQVKVATKLWIFIALAILAICSVAAVGLLRSAAILTEGQAALAISADLVKTATQWTGLTETNGVRNQAILLSTGPAIESSFNAAVDETSGRISALQKS